MNHLRWRTARRTYNITTTNPKKLWPRLNSKGSPTSQQINVVGVLHKLFCLHSFPVDIAEDVVELQFACWSTRLIALCRKISDRFGGKLADVIECRSTVSGCVWVDYGFCINSIVWWHISIAFWLLHLCVPSWSGLVWRFILCGSGKSSPAAHW